MSVLRGLVYTGWIKVAIPFPGLLCQKRATVLLRCNPCTTPSVCRLTCVGFKVGTKLSLRCSSWRISCLSGSGSVSWIPEK